MAYFGENTCHAWANINCVNGQDTVRDSYNISSVTDIGTGRQQFNFSTNAINNDFVYVSMAGNVSSTTTSGRTQNNDNSQTTSSFRLRNLNTNSDTNKDDTLVNVIVISDN